MWPPFCYAIFAVHTERDNAMDILELRSRLDKALTPSEAKQMLVAFTESANDKDITALVMAVVELTEEYLWSLRDMISEHEPSRFYSEFKKQ